MHSGSEIAQLKQQRVAEMEPTFMMLLSKHHVTIPVVARAAQVNILHVSTMYLNHPISRDIAVRVLQSFSQLCGTQYTLENTNIQLEN